MAGVLACCPFTAGRSARAKTAKTKMERKCVRVIRPPCWDTFYGAILYHGCQDYWRSDRSRNATLLLQQRLLGAAPTLSLYEFSKKRIKFSHFPFQFRITTFHILSTLFPQAMYLNELDFYPPR